MNGKINLSPFYSTLTSSDELEIDSITDEYLLENWRELLSIGLSDFDENYYKSDQYREDLGRYLAD